MFSDYYLQLSYNHHIHKNVTLEQIFHGDTKASTIYPENIPDEFITSIISNNNNDYHTICEPLVDERCIPNTDIVLRKLYGFWKRNYIDDTDKSQKTMHVLIMNFAYDYAYNTYISEYYKKRINFIYENVTDYKDKYIINNCPFAIQLQEYIYKRNWGHLISSPIIIDYDTYYTNEYYNKLLHKYGRFNEFYPINELLEPFDGKDKYPDRVPDEFLYLFVSFEERPSPYWYRIVQSISNTNINIRKLYNLWIHKCTWNTYEKLPSSKFNSLYYMIMKMAKQIIRKEYTMSFTARVKLLYDYTYIIGYTDITIKEHKKINKMTKNNNALTKCIHEFIRNKKWNHLLENA